jgi:hypothetical protein
LKKLDKAFTRMGALSLILFLVAVSFISSVAIGHLHYGSSTSSTTSTTTTRYSVARDFYVVVNYSSRWTVYYQGFASSNIYDPTNRGNFTGSGLGTVPVGVNGSLSYGVSLCITAQKQDNSSKTLYAAVFLDNPVYNGANYSGNTSEPFGIVDLCIDVGPY